MAYPARRGEQAVKLTAEQHDGNLDAIDAPSKRVITISAGIITLSGPGTYYIETEGGAMTDAVTQVNGMIGRDHVVYLHLNTAGREITFIHNPPVLRMAMGAQGQGMSFIMDSIYDTLTLWSPVGTTSAVEMNRSSVPA